MSYEDVKSQPVPKSKRILVVCAAGYTYGKETVTLSLIEGLSKRGHEVSVLTSTWSDGKFESELNRLSILNRQLPLGFISKQLLPSAIWMSLDQLRKLPTLWIGYARFIRQFKPDIVLHSNFHHVFLLLPILGRSINVFHVHDAVAATNFYRKVFKLLNRKISAFVGVSKFVAHSLVELGLPQVKIKYVLNGIVVDKQERCSGCASQDNHEILADSPIRIGIVGQVEEWKGHEDLIDALHILDRKDEPFLCRIFGADNSAFALRLKSRIEEYGLTDNVEWVGFVANKNLIYDAIDVCVAPSRFQEPFGMVAAEAALHGLPVIASRVGGFPEVIINEQTGYLVDAKCPEQIAEKIRVLLASPAKRVEMGMRARTYVESSLGADKMIERMETIIRELAQGKLLEEPN